MKNTLDLISTLESGDDPDRVWDGIKKKDRPRKLTSMTVYEVLQWQDSIDKFYRSEAAGLYQLMEDTLRELVEQGKVDGNSLFDRVTQDYIAVVLMRRRGLSNFLKGRMSIEDFGNRLACEWASLPCVKDFTLNGKVQKERILGVFIQSEQGSGFPGDFASCTRDGP